MNSNIAEMPIDQRRTENHSRRFAVVMATLQGALDELQDLTIRRPETVSTRADEIATHASLLTGIAIFAHVNSKAGDAA